MSNMSLSRPGYASHRSPTALAAAIALNGGVIALLAAIPAAQILIHRDPPLRTTSIELAPPPPPVREQIKPRPQTNPAQKAADPIRTLPDPFVPETIVPTGGDPIAAGDFGKSLPVVESGLEQTPPHVPVFVSAKPDPRYADAFHPDYPPALRREGLEGSVTVRIMIDERGRVVAVELVRATNPAFFTETKRQALAEWRFRPAMRDGAAVRTEQAMTVHFRLEE
jgi:protein TonB